MAAAEAATVANTLTDCVNDNLHKANLIPETVPGYLPQANQLQTEWRQKAEERALNQIEEMRYADGMYVQGYQKVIKYGAAFYRKSCLVGRCEV